METPNTPGRDEPEATGPRTSDEADADRHEFRTPSMVAADAALFAAEAFEPGEEPIADPAPGGRSGRIARSTAFFSIATAASRIAGLVREVFAASYYGVNGPMSAFTIAFQVPNLVRSLFADAALQPAFIPIFTEQLEQKNYREAFRLASTLLLLVTLVLGAITALFVLAAAADHAALRARLLGQPSSTSRSASPRSSSRS